MAKCTLCNNDVAVSLYIRAKPIIPADPRARRYTAAKNEYHKFFGYWPQDSHLANYFRLELQRNQNILQPLFDNNCRGHSVDEIAAAIEDVIPPIQGVPVQFLWNPSPRVTPFLFAETFREREEARLEINNDLRKIICFDVPSIKSKLLSLLNSAEQPDTAKVFYPWHSD